jgi:hypothetical protein
LKTNRHVHDAQMCRFETTKSRGNHLPTIESLAKAGDFVVFGKGADPGFGDGEDGEKAARHRAITHHSQTKTLSAKAIRTAILLFRSRRNPARMREPRRRRENRHPHSLPEHRPRAP